jgi:multicomponent Na+:H+ antiporter subunit B
VSAGSEPGGPQAQGATGSLILRSATRYLLPLLLLFSVFLLLRGHQEPGGGFAGGLVASAAFVLYSIAHGVAAARRSLPLPPGMLIGLGLLLAGASGVLALALGQPLLTAQWSAWPIPILGEAGTPLVFDAGVFLTVAGVVLLIVFSLMEAR